MPSIYSTRKSCAPSPDLPVGIQHHQFCISFLSLLYVIFTWRHTLLPTVHSTPEDEISSTAILSSPCQLCTNHPFSFLAHFYLGTYIVFLFRILQFRTCPHLSSYFIFFIIWGNIHYSVGRTTSVWTVSQFVDPVLAGRLLPSASHVPSLGMECSLVVY